MGRAQRDPVLSPLCLDAPDQDLRIYQRAPYRGNGIGVKPAGGVSPTKPGWTSGVLLGGPPASDRDAAPSPNAAATTTMPASPESMYVPL